MYDVNDYGRMMADDRRMRAYTEALRSAVKPGAVVVDVGTGTGIFALLAAKLGARRVYAIDTNPCIELAREIAERNGLAQRIVFIEADVHDVELPEKADVIVSDCRGGLPWQRDNLRIMARARSFATPTTAFVSEMDELIVAPLGSARRREILESQWIHPDLDFEPCRIEARSTPIVVHEPTLDGELLSPGEVWARLSYRDSPAEAPIRGHARFVATHGGTVHFLCLWFRARLHGGFMFENAPTEACGTYARMLLPLERPLEVPVGAAMEVELSVAFAADDAVLSWSTRFGEIEVAQTASGLLLKRLARLHGVVKGAMFGGTE